MPGTDQAGALPKRMRAAAWSELYSASLDRADLIPADPDQFDAELRLDTLGPIGIVRMRCGAGAIDRKPRHIGHVFEPVYTFLLQVRGAGTFTQYGLSAALGAGYFTLCNGAAPYSYVVCEHSELVMLRAPISVLKEHLPSPEHFCGRWLRAGDGLSESAAELTLSICAQLDAGISLEFHNRVARNLLAMLATSFAISFDTLISNSPVMCGRYARVRLYIEQHLRDPNLGPAGIASGLKLSPRYLRMIFGASSETVSAYILRRRLEECARELAEPRSRELSITDIAFSWGFNSASHFSRSFRDRFRLSPRTYRRLRTERQAPHGERSASATA